MRLVDSSMHSNEYVCPLEVECMFIIFEFILILGMKPNSVGKAKFQGDTLIFKINKNDICFLKINLETEDKKELFSDIIACCNLRSGILI